MNNHKEFPTRRFFRDPKHGLCGGVCAGIADYFGFDVTVVRIVAVVAAFVFPILLLLYLALVLIVPRMPNCEHVTPAERAFRKAARRAPKATFSEVRYSFRDLDTRLQRLERYVTSRRFQLDREFDELRKQ